MPVGPAQVGSAQSSPCKVALPRTVSSDKFLGFHHLDPFVSACHAVGSRVVSASAGSACSPVAPALFGGDCSLPPALTKRRPLTRYRGRTRTALLCADFFCQGPSTSAWSLPWMLLRCKAFAKDSPIIPLISSSGNAFWGSSVRATPVKTHQDSFREASGSVSAARAIMLATRRTQGNSRGLAAGLSASWADNSVKSHLVTPAASS